MPAREQLRRIDRQRTSGLPVVRHSFRIVHGTAPPPKVAGGQEVVRPVEEDVMARRNLLTGLALLAAALFVLVPFSAGEEKKPADPHAGHFSECSKACTDCLRECESCARHCAML